MDNETNAIQTAWLIPRAPEGLGPEPCVIDYGAIMMCTGGTATIRVGFKEWQLRNGTVITLFPNDVVALYDTSPDFAVETFGYDKAMLREASLQVEHAVYSQLRNDRFQADNRTVTDIVRGTFALMRTYTANFSPACASRIALYQLKAFFLGYYDYIGTKGITPDERGSRRVNELFNEFMERLETDYRKAHGVAYFASAMNITPKYLNNIVKRITGHTTKSVIDHYVILQLKLCLQDKERSIKQLAWDFHFSDAAFFCRYFKQKTGMTPQQFRKSKANG